MQNATWAEMKQYVDGSGLRLRHDDLPDRYRILIDDRGVSAQTILWKPNATATGVPSSNASDLAEFEATYKTTSNKFLPKELLLLEETTRTGGHYQTVGVDVVIPAGVGWTTKDFSWPFPISLLAAEAYVPPENDGDRLECIIGPDTIIGVLTANAVAGATVLQVQQSVIDNIAIGRFAKLYDGTNQDDCGRVLGIDKQAATITVETPTVNTFPAASTYVQMTTKLLYSDPDGVKIRSGHRMVLGEEKVGGSYVPANTACRFRYNNVDGVAKDFTFMLGYLY